MQNQEELTPAQQELECVLGSLQPAAGRRQRDRLMYRAGQVSMKRRNFFWPTIATVLAVMLGVSILYRPPAPAERIVYVERPATPENNYGTLAVDNQRPPRPAQYIILRDKILTEGMEALPEFTGSNERNQNQLWQELQQLIPHKPKIKGI